jgi:alpha-galactosidase
VDSCCGSTDHQTAFADYAKWRDGFNKTGRPVYVSLCGWNTWYAPVGKTLGNSWRIAGDGTNWGALSNCINLNSKLQKYASPGAWNDPDLLQGTGVGSNDAATNPSGCFVAADIPQAKDWFQTELQSRAQMSMWAIMSSPLLISADVGQVSAFQLETWGNSEVIAVNQQFREDGPYQGARLFGGDLNLTKVTGGEFQGQGQNVWGKLLPGLDFALVFVSNEDTPTNVTCGPNCFSSMIHWGPPDLQTDSFTVRDLWKHEIVGTVRPPYYVWTAELPAHGGAAAFRFSPTGPMSGTSVR